jgi:hypothetical protein
MSGSFIISGVEIAVVIALACRMVIAGFFQPPGQIFSWPMFTRGCQILVDIWIETDNGRQVIDPMLLLPAHHPSMSVPEFQVVLDYITQQSGTASGNGVAYTVRGLLALKVEDGRVVV